MDITIHHHLDSSACLKIGVNPAIIGVNSKEMTFRHPCNLLKIKSDRADLLTFTN